MIKPEDIKVGDKITFLAITRWSDKLATRVVNGVPKEGEYMYGYVSVRYGGYGQFYVKMYEIKDHIKAGR